MSNPESDESKEPKIIVDDDWKEQVAKEKQAALEKESETEALIPPTESVETDHTDQGMGELPALPPASFDVLVSMLFSQALAMLGQMPDPSGKTQINKPYAKHTIDTLEMLGEKTKGNLSDEESKILSEALHALRMAYVSVKAEKK